TGVAVTRDGAIYVSGDIKNTLYRIRRNNPTADVLAATLGPLTAFDTQTHPPAPDYAQTSAWAALPTKHDLADLAPKNTRYPEAEARADADVFYIHPTTF